MARADGWAADLRLLRPLLGDADRWRDTLAAKGHLGLPEFKLRKLRARWDHIATCGSAAHPHQPACTGG